MLWWLLVVLLLRCVRCRLHRRDRASPTDSCSIPDQYPQRPEGASRIPVCKDGQIVLSRAFISQPLVRSITCWTLGRYASWCTQPISDEHKNQFFVPTLEGVSQSCCSESAQQTHVIHSCSGWSSTTTSASRKLDAVRSRLSS